MDSTLGVAFDVLDYALLSAPGAPLKQALLDAGIGKDIYGDYSDGVLQPYFSVIAKGARAARKEEFVSIIRKLQLEDIVKNGIDKKAVLSGINYMEFRYREADFGQFPKGLMYGLDIMGSWLYDDENAFSQVKLLEIYDQLKIAVNEGYFENLIQKWLLDNTHGAILTLVPKRGLAAQREKELADRLEAYRSSLSDEQLEEMVRKTKALEAYQESEERPEDLECIPMLKRSDIRKEVNGFSNEELQVEDSLFLYQDVCTNGIGYVNIMVEIRESSFRHFLHGHIKHQFKDFHVCVIIVDVTIYLACGNQTVSVFLFFFIRHVSHLLSIAGRIHRPAAFVCGRHILSLVIYQYENSERGIWKYFWILLCVSFVKSIAFLVFSVIRKHLL